MAYSEDRGIIFRFNTGYNLSGLSSAQVKMIRPNGATLTWSPSIYDEAAGILQYITSTSSNEIDTTIGVGTTQVQVKLTFVSGNVFHSSVTSFSVAEVLIPTS